MSSEKSGLTLIAGDQASLRRKLVQDLLHFRSVEANETLDRMSRRGKLRAVSVPDVSGDTPPLPRAR
jgi:hypothetical protein